MYSNGQPQPNTVAPTCVGVNVVVSPSYPDTMLPADSPWQGRFVRRLSNTCGVCSVQPSLVHRSMDDLAASHARNELQRTSRMGGRLRGQHYSSSYVYRGQPLRAKVPVMEEAFVKVIGASLGAFGVWAVLAGIIVPALSKAFPEWRKVSSSNETSIRDSLMHRVETLEARVVTLEAVNLRQREQYEAEIRIMRHRLNNESATFDMLLMLIEAAPLKITDHVDRIKKMRFERAQNVAIESGAMVASSVDDGRAVV